MTSASTSAVFAGLTTTLGEVLTTNLPLIFGIVAGLFGLTLLIRWAKRWIK